MKVTGLIYNLNLQFKYTAAKYRLANIPACTCLENNLGVGE